MTKPNDSSRDPVLEVHEESDEEPQAASGAAEHSPEAPSGAEHAEQEAEPPKARYTVDFDLTLESATYFWAGSAMNLSRGGFFVATHILQDIGERFKFTIRLPETSSIVKGIGEVRWHRPKDESEEAPAGMGIRFVELEAGAAEAIEDYLAPRAPIRWDAS